MAWRRGQYVVLNVLIFSAPALGSGNQNKHGFVWLHNFMFMKRLWEGPLLRPPFLYAHNHSPVFS